MTEKQNAERKEKMQEAIDYLNSTPYFAKKSSLENIRKYLERFGNPESGMKFIHVAGTNGKGSVCMQTASCLREAGFRVGLFTSPHLTDIRERMQIDSEMISEEDFLRLFEKVREECREAAAEGLPHLLYFEILFVMAMLWFASEKPDYVVLETGLGGRLDATNCIEGKVVTVITRIALDHTAYLGNTLRQIAGEKAGILRKECPVVFLSQPVEAAEAIREMAERVGAPPFEVSPAMWRMISADENGIDFLLYSRYDNTLRMTIPDRALYQCENAALAVTACGILLRKAGIPKTDIPQIQKRGIEKAVKPGRMEEILPHIYLDGAHNPDGIRAFLESVEGIVGQRGETERCFLLFSCVSDKDYTAELEMIARSGLFTDLVVVPMKGKRALDIEALREIVSGYVSEIRIHETASVEDAVERFLFRKEKGDRVFAAGSLYLIGEIRGLITERTKRDGDEAAGEGI